MTLVGTCNFDSVSFFELPASSFLPQKNVSHYSVVSQVFHLVHRISDKVGRNQEDGNEPNKSLDMKLQSNSTSHVSTQ